MKDISARLLALFIGLFIVVFATSFLINRYEVEGKLRDYVGLWEVDISKSMMVHEDKTLMDKILMQLRYVESSVELAEAHLAGKSEVAPNLTQFQKLFQFEIPVSLHLIPVGQIQIRLSPEGVMFRTVTSFLFLSGVGLLMFFFLMVRRREVKNHYEKTLLQERMQFESEIATLSKQVAHDIRAPLSALMAVSQSRNPLNDTMKPLLSQASERILGIAEDLLRLSREKQQLMCTGPSKVRLNEGATQSSPHELETIVQAILNEFQVRYPHVQFQKTLRLKDARLDVSSAQLSRALSNMIQNSVDSLTDRPSPTVSIALSEDRDRLAIQVQDNGKGMEAEVVRKIQTEGGTFGKSSGNGLGLQLVRQMIRDCQGEFQIYSKPNQGSVFSLSFPCGPKS